MAASDLDAVEVDHDAAGGAARDVLHLVRLQRRLHAPELRKRAIGWSEINSSQIDLNIHFWLLQKNIRAGDPNRHIV